MWIGNQELTRADMPSYVVGGNYQDRLYQVYQDIIAAKKSNAVANPVQEPQQQAQATAQMTQ